MIGVSSWRVLLLLTTALCTKQGGLTRHQWNTINIISGIDIDNGELILFWSVSGIDTAELNLILCVPGMGTGELILIYDLSGIDTGELDLI